MMSWRARRFGALTALASLACLITTISTAGVGSATVPATINGTGSSYDAPAIDSWIATTSNAPYNLKINYAPTNSGTGRFEFTNQTVDWAASDIGYIGTTDTTPPSFPFVFIPIVAAGIAFMYNVPGLTQQLQLSSYTACALLTGGITNWDSPALAADNPGVTLPNLPVVAVTESDSAGTNYVLEEWCIHEQPALWAAFVHQQESQAGGPTDGVSLSATNPNSNWPGIAGGLDEQLTAAVAADVASTSGAIGSVQVAYAQNEAGFSGTNPSKDVALVKNASGDYTAPTPVDVTSALAYATQLPDGTHQLNFDGTGPHVYNPSTYSYLLVPTSGWPASKGATMSEFIDYALTLGQQTLPSIGYASLGLSLEQYGINVVKADVPGAISPTAAELAAYSCGDLTPAEVEAGATSPSCGVVTGTEPPPNGTNGSVFLVTDAPNGPFSSGQTIEVKVDANATLSPDSGIYIEECASPGGLPPTSPSECDDKTFQHTPVFAQNDGSIDSPGYSIFALPDSTTLGEGDQSPTCNLSDQCVLYVGENPNNFSLPHIFSASFYVNPTPGDTGANPGNGLPEVPFIVLFPIVAMGLFGAVVMARRRKRVRKLHPTPST
jgi:ABC-type phosphate transport system substrate-binding protein